MYSSCIFYLRERKPTLFPSHTSFSRYSRVSLYSHPHFSKQRLKRLSERFWGRGVTRTGPEGELSYQVQPILCASAVQRQWIVKSVQYCAKFTLDKSRYKCLVKWLLLHYTAVFKESNLQHCQIYPIICTNYSTFPVAPVVACSAGESWSMSGFRSSVQISFRTLRLQLSTSDS